MKVKTAFQFDEQQLRTIRASIGRGGKATRAESRIFIDRAVRKALDDAPEPKRVSRVKREAPKPDPRASESEDQELARHRQQRDRIARTMKVAMAHPASPEAVRS